MPHIRKFHLSRKDLCLSIVLNTCLVFSAFADITLDHAITMAIQQDPWLSGNQLHEQALRAKSKGADTLPDPTLSLGLVNLPTNGFAFDQEPITQLKVGVAQMFPRGESLAIRQQQLDYQANQYPHQRDDRKAKIRVSVTQLWLEAAKVNRSIRLIKADRPLFEQLVDIVKASYSSAQGNTRQLDVIRAQLELARLDDRLSALVSQRDSALAQLYEWFSIADQITLASTFSNSISIPELPRLNPQLKTLLQRGDKTTLVQFLNQHPAILAIQQLHKAQGAAVTLAKQKYQPQWGVNASYAYRDDDQLGHSRADFFSIGVTLELPLFGTEKQDSEVKATQLSAEAIETDKRLLQQQMLGKMFDLYQQSLNLGLREQSFTTQIVPQTKEQADAALSSYTNDEGDFSEVIRARIALLNAQIDLINIQNQKLQTQAQLRYFLAANSKLTKAGATL
jgi:outer membrane protein TolC